MSRQTLAGRLALVQSGLTLLALAAVVVGTWFAMTSLLERKRDASLNDAVQRAIGVANLLGVYAQDAEWMERELSEIRPHDIRLDLQDPSGFILAASGPDFDLGPARLGCHDRGALRACAASWGIFTIRASSATAPDAEELQRFTGPLLLVSAAAGALVLVMSRHIASRTLRPLTDLADAVSSIVPGSGDRLGKPLAFLELERLRERFDQLLDRFHQALDRERRLTAQASHELRTPLGVARGEIEALSDDDFEQGKARALAALDRLVELVEVLLWFARVQQPLDDNRMGIVNVADLVRSELSNRRLDVVATVSCRLPDEALVRGDEHLLRRVTANLVDNAVKHGDGAAIDITGSREGERLVLTVASTGGGLAFEERERLFEPFFRGTSSINRTSGFGLGLPFARGVARAHGGDVELVATGPARTEFTLTLPLKAWTWRPASTDAADD